MYQARLEHLRIWLETQRWRAFWVPREDEFLTKMTAPYAHRLEWLCGFSGTAGDLLVTDTKAILFTDRRYSLSASKTLDAKLFQVVDYSDQTPVQWLSAHLKAGDSVAYDPWLCSIQKGERNSQILGEKGIHFVSTSPNPIDSLWEEQPQRPSASLFEHPLSCAGESSLSKRARIAASLPPESCLFMTANDALCWLLNLRGQDTEHSPLFHGYGLLETSGRAHLFVAPQKVPDALREELAPQVSFWDREALETQLVSLLHNQTLFLDPEETPIAIAQLLKAHHLSWKPRPNPCMLPKALKNERELSHIREDHVRDGVALVQCFHWLETQAPLDGTLGEWEVAQKLIFFKKRAPSYWSESFDAIIGCGAHSASIHHRATRADSALLRSGELLLVDTGTQYRTGTTTDVTRTLALGGRPTALQKELFTRVLKGHIQLSLAVFPEKTRGSHLDALARLPLWEVGLDYPHSTGHGVGSFLNVHETPPSFTRQQDVVPLQKSMVITIEPGYYKAGDFGIRLENMVEIVEKPSQEKGESFLGFTPLTLVPFELCLIEASLLVPAEKQWLNQYHQRVFDNLSPLLDPTVRKWLREKTRALEEGPQGCYPASQKSS